MVRYSSLSQTSSTKLKARKMLEPPWIGSTHVQSTLESFTPMYRLEKSLEPQMRPLNERNLEPWNWFNLKKNERELLQLVKNVS